MWLIDFNNVAIEKIQPDTKPTSCAYTHTPTHTHTHAHICIIYLCVCADPYNNLFLYLFGKLRRNGPNCERIAPWVTAEFCEKDKHSNTHSLTHSFTHSWILWCLYFRLVRSLNKLAVIILIKSYEINTVITLQTYPFCPQVSTHTYMYTYVYTHIYSMLDSFQAMPLWGVIMHIELRFDTLSISECKLSAFYKHTKWKTRQN